MNIVKMARRNNYGLHFLSEKIRACSQMKECGQKYASIENSSLLHCASHFSLLCEKTT
jgi:hypothetical protein